MSLVQVSAFELFDPENHVQNFRDMRRASG